MRYRVQMYSNVACVCVSVCVHFRVVQVTDSVRIVLKDRGWKEAGKKKNCHLDLRTYRFKESEYNEANEKDDLKLNHFPRTSDITQKARG